MRKIRSVRINRRKKAFDADVQDRGAMEFPFVVCDPCPSDEDPVVRAYIDPEVGGDGFTYVLRSGEEGVVLSDHILDYHRDPEYLHDLLLYRLSVEAQARFEESPLGIRQLARRMGTSPAQVYRLLDQTNYAKSADQMIKLLAALDAEVEIRVVSRR